MFQNLENTIFFKFCTYELPAPTLEVTADTVFMVWLRAWDNLCYVLTKMESFISHDCDDRMLNYSTHITS